VLSAARRCGGDPDQLGGCRSGLVLSSRIHTPNAESFVGGWSWEQGLKNALGHA